MLRHFLCVSSPRDSVLFTALSSMPKTLLRHYGRHPRNFVGMSIGAGWGSKDKVIIHETTKHENTGHPD